MPFIEDIQIVSHKLQQFAVESFEGKAPVINQHSIDSIIKDLELESYVSKGGLTEKKLDRFLEKYLSYATRLHHPGYLGHQCAAPHYSGALGALVDGFINNPMAVFEMGPAAASIEHFIIEWMLSKVGWQSSFANTDFKDSGTRRGAGVLVNGGSLANLLALLVARKKIEPDVWESGGSGDLAILVSSLSHYSAEKSAGIMGIGKNAVYQLAVDEKGAILPQKMQQTLSRLLDDGKKPLALVANACSTALGIYDPLASIADFCERNGIWLHVDAAHGASALLSEKHKHKLDGLERADSMIWDAHKMLQTPSLCASVLVKNKPDLDTAMHHDASYLFYEEEQIGFDFIQRTIECTKLGLGTKLFFVLGALGEQGLTKYIDAQCALALKAYHYIQSQDDFDCPVEPQSNIVCFRMDLDDSKLLSIRDALIKDGQFYLTSTLFNDERYLRLVFMSPNTKMTDIHRLIDKIRMIAVLET